MGNGKGSTHSFCSLLGHLRRRLKGILKCIYAHNLPSGTRSPEGVGMNLFTLGEGEIQCFLCIFDIKIQ